MVDSKQDMLGKNNLKQGGGTDKQPSPYSEPAVPQETPWAKKVHEKQPSPYSERG